MTLNLLPWAALAVVLSGVGGAWWGVGKGKDLQIAEQAKTDQAVAEDRAATLQIVGEQIAGIKVINRTNETRLEREIVRVPDLSQCHAGPDVKRVLDDALAGRAAGAEPVGGGVLPGTDPAG